MDAKETRKVKKKDEKNEKTLKIGVIDVVIVVVLLALIVTSVLRFTAEKGVFVKNTKTYEISFSVKCAPYSVFELIEEGNTVFLDGGNILGDVIGISANPAVFYARSGDEIIKAYYPENTYCDVSGLMTAELVDRDGRLVTPGGDHICAGAEIVLHTRTVDVLVTVTSVTPVEEPAT